MLLEKFKTAKQPEIQALRQLEYINMLPLPLRIERPSFLNALCAPNGNRPHVIAEFKRASPSRGDILMDFPPEEAAKQYAEAGASCLSVLTEETYFKGTLGYLKRMSAPGRLCCGRTSSLIGYRWRLRRRPRPRPCCSSSA